MENLTFVRDYRFMFFRFTVAELVKEKFRAKPDLSRVYQVTIYLPRNCAINLSFVKGE